MGTEKGSRAVADAIKDIEVEKIRGPGNAANVKLGSLWEDQVPSPLCSSCKLGFSACQLQLSRFLQLTQRLGCSR